MNATISTFQHSSFSHTSLAPLHASTHAASQLRESLMSRAPAAHFEFWNWRARRAVVEAGLVDVRRVARRLTILPAPSWSAARQRFWVRPEVASRLDIASRVLPSPFALGFWEGFRPLGIQSRLWKIGLELLAVAHPNLNGSELESVLETFIARPTPHAPHTLGRAVDVAILDEAGRVLEDREPLMLLSNALREAGLSNYEPEWWHWSFDEDADYLQ